VLGGRGTLAWPAVTHLTSADMWLYVHGKQPSGRPSKLTISLVHLDKPADEMLAAIRAPRFALWMIFWRPHPMFGLPTCRHN
jgi:hypothetical protein